MTLECWLIGVTMLKTVLGGTRCEFLVSTCAHYFLGFSVCWGASRSIQMVSAAESYKEYIMRPPRQASKVGLW